MSSYKLTTKPKDNTPSLEELHLSEDNRSAINQLLEEFRYYEVLRKHQIPVENKILFHGASGCGKTATAQAIAKKLNKKLVSLNLATFVSSKLGETSRNITDVFSSARLESAVLFIDEFDFIGKSRDYDQKDSGEMKRVVNTLLQLIDNLEPTSLLIAATNYLEVIDEALLRRFQMRLKYNLPSQKELDEYYDALLKNFPEEWTKFPRAYQISYAEAKDYTFHKLKQQIIHDEKQKPQYLFSYGTLQSETAQQELYGRRLMGTSDILRNYRLEHLDIKDPALLQAGQKHEHPIAMKSHINEDEIKGLL